jgi:lambda repressor-like predicted transcriptional regulator
VNYYGKQPNQKYFIKEQLLALALKNKGLSNRSIAKQIGCSKNTVKNLLNKTWQLKA